MDREQDPHHWVCGGVCAFEGVKEFKVIEIKSDVFSLIFVTLAANLLTL